MSQLTHPNTVAVFDYGRSPDGVFYYAMEYLDGINLEQLVGALRAAAGRARRVTSSRRCAARCSEAHGRGIIHRDIKPANIILCERGGMPDVAKVVDFGLVKEIDADTGASTQVDPRHAGVHRARGGHRSEHGRPGRRHLRARRGRLLPADRQAACSRARPPSRCACST